MNTAAIISVNMLFSLCWLGELKIDLSQERADLTN